MTLEDTRHSLHAVAELVLAGPQHRRTGEIALIVEKAGFRTSTEPRLAVDGTDLVAGELRIPISGSTPAQLAAAAGVDAGAPENLYKDGSGAEPGEILHLDPAETRQLQDAWAAGEEALRRLGAGQPILWPEHFDVGVLADGVDYGVSPGDGYLGEPYAYVNPGPHPADEFWNAPFGAARPVRELGGAEGVLAFFADARDRVRAASQDPRSDR
jgi:hypothetical protein